MSNEKTDTEARVALFVEKGYAGDEQNLMIGVNGVTYLLPKGKTSQVPRHIAEEYHRARRAQQMLDEQVDRLLSWAPVSHTIG